MSLSSVHRKRKTLSRKQGQLHGEHETLAYDRIVYLPFDLATIYAAAQNFRIDLAKGVHPGMHLWALLHRDYFAEALEHLKEDGCNLFPGDNNEPWIHVQTIGMVSMPSARATKLAELFTMLFGQDDASLFASEFYPDLRCAVTDNQVEALFAKFQRHFHHH